jgi:hypothetical protein
MHPPIAYAPIQHASTKARGVLFYRESLMAGGLFREVFAVLRKGKLDLYSTQEDFEAHGNPLNPRPIKMWEYDMEQNVK